MGRLKSILAMLKGGATNSAVGLFLFFVRTLLVISLAGIVVCAAQLVKSLRPQTVHTASHEPEHGDDHGEKNASHGGDSHGEGTHGEDTSVKLGASPLPKVVLEAQDGVPEDDNDLQEPDLQVDRGLASLMQEDLKLDFGPRFIELPQVVAGTRAGMNRDGVIVVEVTLEVRDREAQGKLQARVTELQSVISGVIGETKMDDLSSAEGLSNLKASIQNEINHMVGPGTIRDVLFSSIVKR